MLAQDLLEDYADTHLTQIVRLLKDVDASAYLVGGAVRDWILRKGARQFHAYCDLDFAVPGDGLRLAREMADALGGAFYPLDAERGVGRVVLTGEDGEIQTMDVARFQGSDLMADLAGRDFTVNAMAFDLRDPLSPIIDPHGGQDDLQVRRLHAVSNQALSNDPVRGLRAVRLAAELGFEIEAHTRALIREAAQGLVDVSAERVRDELVKILSLPSTADWLRQLESLTMLVEVLPEVMALKGVAQTPPHRWDVYEHTLQTVAALETWLPVHGGPPDPDMPYPDQVANHLKTTVTGGHSRRLLLTLAALLHDVGKRDTATVESDGRVRFIDHERVGATMAAGVLRRLRFSGEEARLVETTVRHHLRPLQLAWQGRTSKRAIYRFFRDTGDAGVEVALLALADRHATVGPAAADDQFPALLDTVGALLDAYFNRQQTAVAPAPLLTGRDMIDQFGLTEGPEVGRLLADLKEAQATGQVTTRAQADEWVRHRIGD